MFPEFYQFIRSYQTNVFKRIYAEAHTIESPTGCIHKLTVQNNTGGNLKSVQFGWTKLPGETKIFLENNQVIIVDDHYFEIEDFYPDQSRSMSVLLKQCNLRKIKPWVTYLDKKVTVDR